jgi:oligoendopeptidase F
VDLNKKDIKLSIEETKEVIIKAFEPLGSEYINNVKKAFNEH